MRDKERGSGGTMDVVILTEMASQVRGYEEHERTACATRSAKALRLRKCPSQHMLQTIEQ